MFDQHISPLTRPIHASLKLPGSKSMSNRALLLAALAHGRSKLEGVLFSEDTEAFIQALIGLGIRLHIDRERCRVEIEGQAGNFPNKQARIYCKDAGTATRFLIPICAAIPGSYHFSATERMSERPIQPLLDVLQEQGAQFMYRSDYVGRMPFTMRSHGLIGGNVWVDIEQSSQFLSGLLMAAPYAKSPMVLKSSKDLDQKTYVHMTLEMMAEFGIEPSWIDAKTLSVPQGCYKGREYQIEPDASTASYFFAMAALSAGKIHLSNLSRHSMQGDIQFLGLLEKMGCTVTEEQGGISLTGTQRLKGLGDVDMTGFSDTFMTLAAVAVFADSPTTIHGLSHTRLQESDRIAAVSDGLNRLGIQVSSTQDSLTVYPGQPHGAKISSYKDHRIAMSLSLIGLKVPGVIIEGADCVAKTCPGYFELMKQACGN